MQVNFLLQTGCTLRMRIDIYCNQNYNELNMDKTTWLLLSDSEKTTHFQQLITKLVDVETPSSPSDWKLKKEIEKEAFQIMEWAHD